MTLIKRISATLLILTMTACAQQGGYGGGYGGGSSSGVSKQDAGTVLGGIGGGLLGSQVGKGKGQLVAVGAGALLGAVLGNSVGASLDRADMAYYNQTSQTALESAQPGQTLPWSNPQSGNSGTVTPMAYYQTPQGQYCREYSQTVTVGGKHQQAYGKACRQPDGTWQIVQ